MPEKRRKRQTKVGGIDRHDHPRPSALPVIACAAQHLPEYAGNGARANIQTTLTTKVGLLATFPTPAHPLLCLTPEEPRGDPAGRRQKPSQVA